MLSIQVRIDIDGEILILREFLQLQETLHPYKSEEMGVHTTSGAQKAEKWKKIISNRSVQWKITTNSPNNPQTGVLSGEFVGFCEC